MSSNEGEIKVKVVKDVRINPNVVVASYSRYGTPKKVSNAPKYPMKTKSNGKLPHGVPLNSSEQRNAKIKLEHDAIVNASGATAPFLPENNSFAGGRKRTRKLKRRSKKTRKH